MVVGIALVRTVYCVSPILARPDGKVRFCALTAFTMSVGVSPLAWSLTGSMSTMICRYLPPSGVGKVTPVNRGELLAQVVDPVIVELLFIEPIGAQAELQHRNARGVVRHHGRRLYAGRHQGADRIRRRDDLGDGEIEVDVRLEIDLLYRDAVERLRLHIFDAVDIRADRVLAVGGDALLHLRRAQARVLPDHRDDRNVDLREDVLRHDRDGRDAEKHNQCREDVEGVRKPQREANYAHGSCSRRLMTLRGAVTLHVASLSVAMGRNACSTMGSAILLRDWLCRRASDCRELACSWAMRAGVQSAAKRKAPRLSTSREGRNSRCQE